MDLQFAIFLELIQNLPPRWHHQLWERKGALYPLVWGVAKAIAELRENYNLAQRAALPFLSWSNWLDLHLQGIGLARSPGETDDSAKIRYQLEFSQSRNTREGLRRALLHYFDLAAPQVRLETDHALGLRGQFRIVLEDRTLNWTEFDFSFVGRLIRAYVANGITPSLDIRTHCLIYQQLKAFRFSTQLPQASWQLQPFWNRYAFIHSPRHRTARSLFPQVTPYEWRTYSDRLWNLFREGKPDDTPGAFVLYLADTGQCPFLRVETQLQEIIVNPDTAARPWTVQGFHFYDGFPRPGAQSEPDTVVVGEPTAIAGNYPASFGFNSGFVYSDRLFYYPGRVVPGASTVVLGDPIPDVLSLSWTRQSRELVNRTEQVAIRRSNFAVNQGLFEGAIARFTTGFPAPRFLTNADTPTTRTYQETVTTETTGYIPNVRIGFTKRRLRQFLEVLPEEAQPLDLVALVPRLRDYSTGRWELQLGDEFARLSAFWWDDDNGGHLRKPVLVRDRIYCVLEFLLPAGTDRSINSMVLRLNGEQIHQRLVGIDVPAGAGLGVLIRLTSIVRTNLLVRYPAFRAGRGAAGDVLRDRDYF